MGATYDEVVADYLKTYTNYYTVVDGKQQALSQETLDAIANSNIIKTLQTAFDVQDLKTADLAAEAEEYIKTIGLNDEEIAALRKNLGGSNETLKVETTFPSATKADIDKYGDVHFSITSAELAAAGFEYKDLVKLTFLDKEVIVPIIPQYRYVGAKAVGLVMWEDGTKPAEVEVFNGSFAANYGLADVVREGKDYTVTPKEGVEFPVPVTIEMYEKQGYADTYAIFDLTRSNDREDYRGNTEPYPNLDDEAFANFRQVTTTGMGTEKLYRASSPINPSIGRNTYADNAARAHGVKSFVNLADSAESAAKYKGYAESYYSDQEILFLNLGVDFTTELNRSGLVEAMNFLKDCPTPVLVHCNEGQDRAGFVSALLECLMGATYDEVVADYMVTFYNYYGVQPGTEQYKQISNNVVKNLSTAFGLATDALATADLAKEAEDYFLELGVPAETIAAVKVNLGESETPAKPDYYLIGYINGADYGCEADWENLGEYKFVDGELTATFTQDSYVFVKTGDNQNWYMTESYTEAPPAILKNTTTGTSEKLFVPGNVELVFTLTENEDNTLTLTYAPKPETPAYTLTTTLADGDKVVIYSASAGGAISNADSTVDSHPERYRGAVSVTPVDNKIEEPAEAIVWTVEINESGIAFKDAAGKYLSVPSGYNNLVLDSDCKYWTVSDAATADSVYIISTESKGQQGDLRGIEYFQNKFTTYYASASNLAKDEAAFALQLYKLTED